MPATDERSLRSTPTASPSAPSPDDADGVPPQAQASVAPRPAELVPSLPPSPAYHVHDLAYRGLLSVKAVFLDFLRSFVPAEWVHDLDEDSFTQVESTLVLQDLRKREPDVVWRGRLREVARRLRRLVRLLSRVPGDQVGPLLDWVSAVLRSRLPAEEGSALLGRLKEVRSGEEAQEVATNFERMLDRWLEKTKWEGRIEGRAEGLKATAVRLMAEGMDDAFIARVTGLPPEEIARLRQAEQARQK